jgi:hypothetical protein
MELILRTDSESSAAKIIALAKKLNVIVEKHGVIDDEKKRQEAIERILNFKGAETSSFGDAVEWQRNERNDRDPLFGNGDSK